MVNFLAILIYFLNINILVVKGPATKIWVKKTQILIFLVSRRKAIFIAKRYHPSLHCIMFRNSHGVTVDVLARRVKDYETVLPRLLLFFFVRVLVLILIVA